jgi:hypothetical protein
MTAQSAVHCTLRLADFVRKGPADVYRMRRTCCIWVTTSMGVSAMFEDLAPNGHCVFSSEPNEEYPASIAGRSLSGAPHVGDRNRSDRWVRTRIRCSRVGFAPTAPSGEAATCPLGAAALRVAIWQSTCIVAVSSVAGAFRDNARRPERRALFFQRFLSPALQRDLFQNLAVE